MRALAFFAAFGLAMLTGSPAATQQAASLVPPAAAPVRAEQVPASVTPMPMPLPMPAGGTPLVRQDVEAWLDGYMPYALARGDIAGGVVVVVQGGQVLLQKGYGYSDVARRQPVDPDRTLFRPGSVSKLFTWTAVMQLVEAGRIDLDRDVNAYLDFRIPPRDGKPITMRNIMTHTAGFEESARYTITEKPMALGPLMKTALPARIFAPGTTPAYSNYATALAGYVVERVSGQSFDDYIDARILRPIGMTRSSFRQPLPPALQPWLSKAYGLASSGEAKGFENVGPAPAGSLSATGADMGRFMIAHLNGGQRLLRPETARLMHRFKLNILPPLNRMALGFYEEENEFRNVIGHGGDTQYFHSNLSLFLDRGVGVFVSVNSAGAQGASGPLRTALMQQFTSRYFPVPLRDGRVDAATAREHAGMMAGTYANSRGFKTNFLSILNLFQPVTLGVNKDGGLLAASVAGLASQPRRWTEIAPFVWRDVESGERIAARVVDGKVVRWSFDTVSPFMVFDRVPWYLNSAWLLPVFLLSLGIVALTALAWPAGAIARKRYAAAQPFKGRPLQADRLTKGFAWLALITLAGWATWITIALGELVNLSSLDWLLYTVQILSLIAFVGLFALAAWSAWLAWKDKRGWFSKLWSVLLLLASFMLLWVALGFHLIGFGTGF